MIKYLIILLSILLFSNLTAGKRKDLPIVPLPQQVEFFNGTFKINAHKTAIRLALKDTSGTTGGINQLVNSFEILTGVKPVINLNRDYMIWLGIPAQDSDFKDLCVKLGVWPEQRIATEGYILLIRKKQIIIAANTSTGLFYGIQSLKQLLRSYTNELPQLKLIDWPDLRYRGVQDDISRGPVPTLEFMREQIRRMSEMKINTLSYYTEHVVETEKHGDFAPAGGSISIADWKSLSDYAARHYIKVIGNFQSLGHFEKIMAYPQYAPLGETDRMISPAKKESIQFLEDLISEMAPAFSSDIFNVNCDETWDLGRGASKPLIDSLGIAVVYANHIKHLHHTLEKYNKRLMLWGDIALEYNEILQLLPHNIVLGAWDYSPFDSFTKFFLPFKNAGFEFMISAGVLNSNRIMPDYKMTMTNIRNFTRDGVQHGALGLLNTVWDDGATALFSLDWYGVAYGADQSWQTNDQEIEEFNNRFNRGIYGDEKNSCAQSLNKLSDLTELAPTQEMNDQVFGKTLLPQRGKSLSINLTDWDNIQKITVQAESILNSAQPKIYQQDVRFIQLIIDKYKYMTQSRKAIIAAANNYKMACIKQQNDQLQTRKSLLIALEKLTQIKKSLIHLRDEYRQLWLIENRMYWLDRNLADYDEKISDFKHAEELLMQAIEDFDKGHYLPPPSDVRLGIEERKGQYFQYWLLCGPFPNHNWEGRLVDYLINIEGEAHARPRPGLSFRALDGNTMHWSKFASPRTAEIDLAALYEENTRVLAYAYCTIESPAEMKVKATFGSNDGIQIFLNGNMIYKHFIKRSLIIDEDQVLLPLQKGKNHLLLKIDQNKGGWGFSFRLPQINVRNHKHKYRIVAQEDVCSE
jgi:hypothetical protein